MADAILQSTDAFGIKADTYFGTIWALNLEQEVKIMPN